MSKTDDRPEVEALRKKLGDLNIDLAGWTVEAEGAKKKKAAKAQANIEALTAKRAKVHAKLDALKPGFYDIEGRLIEVEVKPAKAKKAKAPKPEPEAAAEPKTAEGKASKESGERHLAHLAHVAELLEQKTAAAQVLEDADAKKKAKAKALADIERIDAELEGFREETAKRTMETARETTSRNLTREPVETDEQIKARVLAKRAARETDENGVPVERNAAGEETRGGQTEPEAEALDAEPAADELTPKKAKEKGKVKGSKARTAPESVAVDEPVEVVAATEHTEVEGTDAPGDAPQVENVEPQVRRDRWDRPIILTPEGKEEGYRRMTTFIDAIEDKTTLVDWKQRVVVVGVAAIEQKAVGGDGVPEVMGIDEVSSESVLARVEASNITFSAAMHALKKDLRKGKIDSADYADAVAQVERAQKSELNSLVDEAFRAGDGFLKAEAGTRLHKLMEYVDLGKPLPEDVTDLERRDIAAVLDAYKQLDFKILDVERFVVRDDLKAAGTLDRRGSYNSPKLGRRVVAIGDLKTGRMDFGASKMARQLAGYAGGKGWNPAEPEKRENLRCNREVGLIFHIPSGSGICSVYEMDLTVGDKGLKLCSAIYAYRAETSTLAKVTADRTKDPVSVADLSASEVAA